VILDGELYWGLKDLQAATRRIETARDAETFRRIACRSVAGREYLESDEWSATPWAPKLTLPVGSRTEH
jgi:hypothetical protein